MSINSQRSTILRTVVTPFCLLSSTLLIFFLVKNFLPFSNSRILYIPIISLFLSIPFFSRCEVFLSQKKQRILTAASIYLLTLIVSLLFLLLNDVFDLKYIIPSYFISSALIFLLIFLIFKSTINLNFLTFPNIFRYTKGIFLSLFILFLVFQVYYIFNTGIGTDEGNFLYVTKLLIDGKTLYIDFYSRESGSLIFLYPWFSLVPINILNLRVFMLLIHIGIYINIYYLAKILINNKKNLLLVMLVTATVFQSNTIFNFFSGSFIQISNLLALVALNIFYRYIFYNSNNVLLALSSCVLGLSVIVYKGSQIYLLVFFALIILISKKNKQDFSIALLSYITPILGYFLYYAFKTDFYHIYKMLLNDVIKNTIAITLFSVFVLFFVSVKNVPISSFFKFFTNYKNGIILTNIILFITLGYSYLTTEPGYYGFSESLYSGIFMPGFFIFTLQILNIIFCVRHRIALTTLFILFNTYILFTGYGNSGFYNNISISTHVLFIVFIIGHNLILLKLASSNENYSDNKFQTLFIITLNILLSLTIIGAYINAFRLQSLLMLYPVMLAIVLEIKNISVHTARNFIIYPSMIVFFAINIFYSTNYTISTMNEYNDFITYINQNIPKEMRVFSFDTTVLSAIANKNEFSFSSPFSYIDRFHELRDYPDYQNDYNEIRFKYPDTDISLSTDDFFKRLDNVDYIVGSKTYTIKMIQKNNIDEQMLLNEPIYESGPWRIYKK